MARDWAFELGRARAAARIGLDYLRSMVLPVGTPPANDPMACLAVRITRRRAAPSRQLPKRVRLISWNIHRAYDGPGVAAGLRAMMTELEPHLLLLQEVPVYPDGPWWADVEIHPLLSAHDLLFAPMHRVRRPRPYYPFRESGLLMVASCRVEDPRAAMLPAVSRPKLGKDHLIERVVMGARCRVEDVAVAMFNVHLENTARPSGRARQARAAAAVVGDGPAVLCGDFNTMVPRLERVDDALSDAGFARATLDGQPRFAPQLDHLFVRGLRVVRAERLHVRGSDHRPVYGEIEVEG